MPAQKRIAVAGAGLGGLTAAAFLQRAGFDVKIYEQAQSFARIGAGILLSSNVMKVLRQLGLERKLLAAGIKPDAFVSRDGRTGETLYEISLDADSEARFGAPYLNIHRADLHAILATSVAPGTIIPGHRLTALEIKGDATKLVFDNGEIAKAEIVIGADGIRSQVRDIILGEDPPRFMGKVALRAIYPAARLNGFPVRDCVKWWGPDRHIISYFMRQSRDELYVIGVIPASSWESGEASLPVAREEFSAAFDMFHPDLRRVVDVAGEVTLWPIYDRARDDRWGRGPVFLLGDACHPVPPFMAQGGAMAIEDAAILSRCLAANDDLSIALKVYEATRIPRVAEVQRISWDNSWMHGPTETDWLFCYDPCTADLMAACETIPA